MINTIISDIGGVLVGSGMKTGYAFERLLPDINISEDEFRSFFQENIDLIRLKNYEVEFWDILIQKVLKN